MTSVSICRPRRLLLVTSHPTASRGAIRLGNIIVPCSIGRSAVTAIKREGDGATPVGAFALLYGLYRHDRMPRPATLLPLRRIGKRDGWCDAPADRNYNRQVTLPYPASAEALHRTDRLYDIVVVLDYNIKPRRRNAGSAIFFHIAAPGYRPTEGCVAVALPHMRMLLSHLRRGDIIILGQHAARRLAA